MQIWDIVLKVENRKVAKFFQFLRAKAICAQQKLPVRPRLNSVAMHAALSKNKESRRPSRCVVPKPARYVEFKAELISTGARDNKSSNNSSQSGYRVALVLEGLLAVVSAADGLLDLHLPCSMWPFRAVVRVNSAPHRGQ